MDAEPATATTETPDATEVSAASVLLVRPLSVVRQGEDYLVGDPTRGRYVALPDIGVQVLEQLRAGRTVGNTAEWARELTGEEVDVVDFAQAMCAEGFAVPVSRSAPPADDGTTARTQPDLTRSSWAARLFGATGWTLFGLVAAATVAIDIAWPELFPRPGDLFFLSTPVRSVAAMTVVAVLSSVLHEVTHWWAARLEGVPARITIGRRLYLIVFETDLTGLWSIPRRRRYAPLMIGIAMNLLLLFIAQLTLLGNLLGYWQLAPIVAGGLAAFSFLQFGLIVPQFFVFLRTDIYAILATATGCLNLWQVTRLVVRARLRLATAAQRTELARSHPRDLAVARWFAWVYSAGLVLAIWYGIVYFIPVSWQLVVSLVRTIGGADLGQSTFWEALGFGLLNLSSPLLTLVVVSREMVRRRARAAQRG